MLRTIHRHGTTPVLFAAGSMGLTTTVDQLTKLTIGRQIVMQQETLFDQVPPDNCYNNNLSESYYLIDVPALGKGAHRVYIARQDDRPVTTILGVVAPDDYPGVIQLLVDANFTGTVLDTWATEHHKTSGLGDKIELYLSDWIAHFSGRAITAGNDSYWAVKKDNGGFDQFTGTTATPRAVVSAVRRTGPYVQTLSAQLPQLSVYGE